MPNFINLSSFDVVALQMQDQIDKLLAPQRQLEQYFGPQFRLQHHIEKLLEPQRLLEEQLHRAIEERFRRLQEQTEKLFEPYRQLEKLQIEKLFAPQRELEGLMRKLDEPYRLFEAPLKYLRSINDLASDSMLESLVIDQSGNFILGDEVVNFESVQKQLETFPSSTQLSEQFFEALLEWLYKLAPAVKALVLYLLIPYIVSIYANLTTPMYEDWWKRFQYQEPRVAKKEITAIAKETYDVGRLREYRFVASKVLIVHQASSQKSNVLDELYLGKTLKLINRNKQWSFVEYFDESTETHKQGWVLSRYIAKFER